MSLGQGERKICLSFQFYFEPKSAFSNHAQLLFGHSSPRLPEGELGTREPGCPGCQECTPPVQALLTRAPWAYWSVSEEQLVDGSGIERDMRDT